MMIKMKRKWNTANENFLQEDYVKETRHIKSRNATCRQV